VIAAVVMEGIIILALIGLIYWLARSWEDERAWLLSYIQDAEKAVTTRLTKDYTGPTEVKDTEGEEFEEGLSLVGQIFPGETSE
jgi:hypothetical protein